MSREISVGRGYDIDCLDAADWLMGAEEALAATPMQQAEAENIRGFVSYVTGDIKGSPRLPFDKIRDPLATPPTDRYSGRFGLVSVQSVTTMFDYVKGSSEKVLIPRETPVVELRIPIIDFPAQKKVAITASMVTESLALAANYVVAAGLPQQYVVGLTHPRLGYLAERRWGFEIESHPFPSEIYQLIDLGLKEAAANPKYKPDIASMQALRDQVLIYETREEFVKNANLQEGARAIYEAHKPSVDAQVKPDIVIWDKRATNVPPEERARVTQVLQYMREGLGKAGVLGNVLRIEFYQPNKDGENPCLVLLKKASVDSLSPGEGSSIIENIHALERKTWQQFHPLHWRFALMLEGSRPLPLLSERFFGMKRMPKPLAVASGE